MKTLTMQRWLLAAAVYNVLWGAQAVLFPRWGFEVVGMAPPTEGLYLWQCIGMIVSVYGVGYALAGLAPHTHWPIVLVGLLGKIFGPIGFAFSLFTGQVPVSFGLHLVFNDFIWWVPFVLILKTVWGEYLNQPAKKNEADLLAAMAHYTDQHGEYSLADLVTLQTPTLVVFLRHGGCTFCRESLQLLKAAQDQGTLPPEATLAFVHMGANDSVETEALMQRFGHADAPRFSDPACQLYRLAGFRRHTLGEVFGPRVWWRGLAVGVGQALGIGLLMGDGFRQGGWVFYHQGRIIKQWVAINASDTLLLPSPEASSTCNPV